jgi:hypothetical protein
VRHIQLCFLSAEGFSLLADHLEIPPESIWECSVEMIAFPLDSLIISDFPEIFAEFFGKRFKLLWRGSRDGFSASAFHGRCDGHANTVTVILDTEGNIFGGFTPLEWESWAHNGEWEDLDNCCKSDESEKSFLFTLKNPHNIAARKFRLQSHKKDEAILCDGQYGPFFSGICIHNNCNKTTQNFCGSFGITYTNDTGMDGSKVLTGSEYFTVKEIEVFEITD